MPEVVEINLEYRCAVCGHTTAGTSDPCSCCDEYSHCAFCAQPSQNCVCCDCHGVYPCPGPDDGYDDEVEASHGLSGDTPWEKRGVKIQQPLKYASWQVAWPLLAEGHSNLDPCRAAADFYLLDALRFAMVNKSDCPRTIFAGSYDLRSVQAEAHERFAWLVAILDAIFCEYVEMACGGELRHHAAMGNRVVSSVRRTAWAQWKAIHDELGDDCLLDMATLFDEFGPGSFGGAKWGFAARLLHDRLTDRITKSQWVNMVFQLVHNGGVFLNKLDWAVHNRRKWNLHYLQHNVLPAQAIDGWRTLLSVASPRTVALWNDYWTITNRTRLAHGVSPALNPWRNRRRRHLCQCGTNPAKGHLMQCRWFLEDRLGEAKDHALLIDEDDFPSYQWGMWEAPTEDLPIGPNGEIHILPHVQYCIQVWVHSLATVAHRRYQVTGAEMMDTNVKLQPLVVEMEAWWPVLESHYQWRVQLTNDLEEVLLATCTGSKQTKEEISAVILPLGFLLPHLMTNVDWSKVQGGTK